MNDIYIIYANGYLFIFNLGPPVLDEDEEEDVDDLTLSTEVNYQPHLYAQQT